MSYFCKKCSANNNCCKCVGPTDATGPQGPQGIQGPTGATGADGEQDTCMKTSNLGNIDTVLIYNEGSGNFEAFGALVFEGPPDRTVNTMTTYVIQTGSTGNFQMAILKPLSTSDAEVVAITPTVTSLTGGLFVLPLTSPYTLMGNTLYYLAVYNQVNGSELGAINAGLGTSVVASPINFRAQNLSGFTIGDVIPTTDTSIIKTVWLATYFE